MTIQLTLPSEIEQRIVNTAEALNIPIEEYVLSLVEKASAPTIVPAPLANESSEDFLAAMRSLSRVKTPASLADETWDRAAIYGDHA